MTFEEWVTKQLRLDIERGIRLGQSYMNHVRRSESFPKLYYETDPDKCWDMIWDLELQDEVDEMWGSLSH